jgi:hypothetical protein
LIWVDSQLARSAGLAHRPCGSKHPQLKELRLREASSSCLAAQALAVLSGDTELNSDPLRLVAGTCCGGHTNESEGANRFWALDTPQVGYFYLVIIDG